MGVNECGFGRGDGRGFLFRVLGTESAPVGRADQEIRLIFPCRLFILARVVELALKMKEHSRADT